MIIIRMMLLLTEFTSEDVQWLHAQLMLPYCEPDTTLLTGSEIDQKSLLVQELKDESLINFEFQFV